MARPLGEFSHGSRRRNHVPTFVQNDAHLRQQFVAVNTGTNLITERIQNSGRIGNDFETPHPERIEGELLVIVQRWTALPVNGAQRRNLGVASFLLPKVTVGFPGNYRAACQFPLLKQGVATPDF